MNASVGTAVVCSGLSPVRFLETLYLKTPYLLIIYKIYIMYIMSVSIAILHSFVTHMKFFFFTSC